MTNNNIQALIDAGTNTFKLVVFQPGKDPLEAIEYEEEVFVKLWEPEAGIISGEKRKLALDILQAQVEKAREQEAGLPELFCTEAFRTSENGPELLHQIKSKTGMTPHLLTGEDEARIQAQAALYALRKESGKFLSMDIGGGSTELSIIDAGKQEILFSQSLPIGGASLFRKIQLGDPLTEENLQQIEEVVRMEGEELFMQMRTHQVSQLIGSAGVFESIVTVLHHPETVAAIAPDGTKEIAISDFKMLADKAIQSTTAERKKWNGLKSERAKYIGAAFAMLQSFMEIGEIDKLHFSRYGLKEGLIMEAAE